MRIGRPAFQPIVLAALVALAVAAPMAALAQSPGAAPPAATLGSNLTVETFARMLARSDELVRAQAMEESIAGQGLRGARALYEPFLSASINREGKLVPTTAEESFSRGTPLPYESYVNQLKLGVNLKGTTGADWEITYSLEAIVNSLQPQANAVSPEYRGSLGFSVTQPLLRNAGRDVTESGIRVAEREEAIARETVRQVLAQRVGEGLQTYLFVQRAQERVKWRQQAMELATRLEAEISRQVQVGLKSQNELSESRAQLALRRAQLAQAQQDLEEQVNALQVFLAVQAPQEQKPVASRWMPADPLRMPEPAFADSLRMTDPQTAFDQRPETRVNRLRIEREEFKRQFARNQTEPELNLKLRYGKDSLTGQPLSPHEYYWHNGPRYNTWGIGLNLRIGMGGDAKKDSEYQTAVMRKTQAELSLGAAQQRITNELLSVRAVLDRALQQAERQGEIVRAQEDLLAAERRMMAEGQKSLLDVLRREIEIATAREALADAMAQVNRSSFVASQVNGGLLVRLGLE